MPSFPVSVSKARTNAVNRDGVFFRRVFPTRRHPFVEPEDFSVLRQVDEQSLLGGRDCESSSLS
jgi:hypothetical protein